ncbi:MAG: DUF5686 family protein [Paraprevotella sp.]|nr:DUF5686 family protein [Paraprevotella sp.]
MGFIRYILVGYMLLAASLPTWARLEAADSFISRMHHAAQQYVDYVHEYRAELYIKAQLDIIRKNRGFRFIPGLFKTDKDANRFIVETYSDLHYTYPNIYDHNIKAYTGTLGEAREIPGITDYFNVNIYTPYLLGQRLLSPLAPNSNKYYRYAIDSVSCDSMQRIEYHIRFIPRNKSLQLLDGEMVITEGAWSVREISFKGKSDLLNFHCRIKMGDIGSATEYLPVENQIDASFAFAFNVMEGYYVATLSYKDIRNRDNTPADSIAKPNYNLTASFSLQCDRQAYAKNLARFDSLRPIPLTPSENYIYKRYKEKNDSLKRHKTDSIKPFKQNVWGSISNFILTETKWKLTDNATLRNSPFINPLMFSYSRSNGIAYRQDLKFNMMLPNRQTLHIGTRLGYNFTYNEFYWNVGGEYQYWPEHIGVLKINVGNGNRIGNSRIIDELKKIPSDSIINFDKLNYDLFQDLNFEISTHFEILNGLSLGIGVMFHHRTPSEHPEESFRYIDLPENVAEGLQANLRPQYNSIAPRIRIEWTPGQYYYMNGRQKVNLKSRFPTFILDYEHGLKNIFKSTGVYERIELDMQHHIRSGLLSNLYYRVGMGLFTNQEETYFVDFVNFRRSNIPQGWNDEIGGVFQTLDRQWYNASPYYVRGHITYEAPFLLLRHLLKYTNHVQNERLYLNMLTMDHLGPPFEIGYGIGTFIFDMGIFLSVEKINRIGFGYKFTFELFSK